MRAGDEAQRDRWLPRILAGEAVVTVAWLEPDGGFGPAGVQLAARRDGGGYVLDGVKRHVPFARAADALLVLARDDDRVVLAIVDANTPGVTLAQQTTVASDTQYRVVFDDVRVDDAAVLHMAGDGWPLWHDTMLDAVILLAAQ